MFVEMIITVAIKKTSIKLFLKSFTTLLENIVDIDRPSPISEYCKQ